jgi:hypothetical protein
LLNDKWFGFFTRAGNLSIQWPIVASDDKTDSGDKSPQYQESVDSSSRMSSDDAGGGVDVLLVAVLV